MPRNAEAHYWKTAVLADLEMVQFHPTALEVEEDPSPLVTEALRILRALSSHTEFGDTKIEYFHEITATSEASQKNIVRLEVPMDHALCVGKGNRLTNLFKNHQQLRWILIRFTAGQQ